MERLEIEDLILSARRLWLGRCLLWGMSSGNVTFDVVHTSHYHRYDWLSSAKPVSARCFAEVTPSHPGKPKGRKTISLQFLPRL